MCCGVRPSSSSSSPRLPCSRNSWAMPNSRSGVAHVGEPQLLGQPGPAAADHAVVLDRDHQLVVGGELDQGRVDRERPDRVDHGDADPLVGQPLADRDAGAGQLPVRHDQHPRLGRSAAARRRRRRGRPPADRPGPAPWSSGSRSARRRSASAWPAASPQPGARPGGRPGAARARAGGATCPTCRDGWRRPARSRRRGRGRRSRRSGAGRRPSAAGRRPG